MTSAISHFDEQLSTVSQAINTASAALAQGKICDMSLLGEMIDALCETAKQAVAEGDDDDRARIGAALEAIANRMDPLEERLRELLDNQAPQTEDDQE